MHLVKKRGDFIGAPCVPDGLVWKVTAAGNKHLEHLMAATARPTADQRQTEIQTDMATFGYRMEVSLSSFDGDDGSGEVGNGHAVMHLATDEHVDDDELNKNPRALALAIDWSQIENASVRSAPEERQRES